MNKNDKFVIIIVILLAIALAIYYGNLHALVGENTAGNAGTCSVSSTQMTCSAYNRGQGPGAGGTSTEITVTNAAWYAGKNGLTYNKCKVTSFSLGAPSGNSCSCGPGSHSYGCACCQPKVTDLNTEYDATGDSCPIHFDNWFQPGSATCWDNGGQGQSFTATVVFYIPTAPVACVENWTCSGWGDCSNGIQRQTCQDLNSCGTTVNEPVLIQACTNSTSSPTCLCQNGQTCVNNQCVWNNVSSSTSTAATSNAPAANTVSIGGYVVTLDYNIIIIIILVVIVIFLMARRNTRGR